MRARPEDQVQAPKPSSPAAFATTHWSVVLAAGSPEVSEASAALERLCQTYWPPLYAYMRRFGFSPEEAEDLTQDFFAHFLRRELVRRADPERGRFRTFLLTSLRHYLHDANDRQTAAKRGGPSRPLSLDRDRAERGYASEPAEHATPERIFERRWATTLIEQVLGQIGVEFARAAKAGFFDELKGYLWSDRETAPVKAIAARFGMTENAVRVTVHRLRRRFSERLRQEIAHTVTRAEEIDEEIRYLAETLQ